MGLANIVFYAVWCACATNVSRLIGDAIDAPLVREVGLNLDLSKKVLPSERL